MKTIAIVGTFDSKGREFEYLKDVIEAQGLKTLTIHTGVFQPTVEVDISNNQVVQVIGEDMEEIAAKKDRSIATEVLSKAVEKFIPQLYLEGKFDGIISLGGSGGTAIVTPGMRALPIGVPKIMVSTVAAGDVSIYVGSSDIFMYPSIVDVAGLNSISTKIFTNAALAMAGMVKFENTQEVEEKPLIAASMFGVTTPCLDMARDYLEKEGYEVLIFHTTGRGGKAMEDLIASGHIEGVLDITTTEWCDELVGGNMAAGQHRLEAAGKHGIPQVVSTGALDMVNFGAMDTIPSKFKDRNFYKHNPTVTLMRTTVEENKELGNIIAKKLNQAQSPTVLMLPLKGVSMLDAEGQPFYGPEEDEMLFNTLRENIDREVVDLIEMDNNINDEEFALAVAKKLIEIMKK